MQKKPARGFTLVELLVVIAIIGILAAVVMLAINPADILRRGRDSTRMNDLTNLRKAIDMAVADGATVPGSISVHYPGNSLGDRTASSPSNYVGIDVSKYISVLPKDPQQGVTPAPPDGKTAVVIWQYTYEADGTNYELNAFFESKEYADKYYDGDGGLDGTRYEVGTSLTVISP